MQDKEYEIEFEDIIENIGVAPNTTIEDYILLETTENRRIYINTEIDDTVSKNLIFCIMKYNREDKDVKTEDREPIIIYLDSDGGYVDSGLAVIDIILSSKTPVWIVNYGRCCSMAAIIYSVATKRFALSSSTITFHDGSISISNSFYKATDIIEFNIKIKEKVKKLILDKTKISSELYEENKRIEWFLHADEAQKLGIVDCIVGVDCDLDEII